MRRLLALACLGWASAACAVSPAPVPSPDGKVVITAWLGDGGALTYQLSYRGSVVIGPSTVGLRLAGDRPDQAYGVPLMGGLEIIGIGHHDGRDSYAPIHGKVSHIDDGYREMVIHARETGGAHRAIDLTVRAYDQGAAFRIAMPGDAPIRLLGEDTSFSFPRDYHCLGLNIGQVQNSHEGEFDFVGSAQIRPHNRYDMPLVCQTGQGETTFALTESDLHDYAGAYLSGRDDGRPGVAIKLTPRIENDGTAVRSDHGVATPWRVVMIAERADKLVENQLVDDLARPSVLADTGWISPGKASWDWWSGPDVPNPGFDNATYRRFIDFAARFGLPYTLIDEGWAKGAGGDATVRPDSDITQTAPGVDMPALASYARGKGVGLWLWANWKAMDRQMDQALPLYERWGIKGIKIDFMDRQDQAMVDFYHRLLAAAAQHHLMVDLHGAYVPRGLERTYPNFMTQEGVMGAEYNKWSRRITATHNVRLAYTRNLLGPMDYTPGGFRNVTSGDFVPRNVAPEVMTTRAQQLAMYVVYTSPFACLADTPAAYEAADLKPVPGADFLKRVPTTWDETRALGGAFGQYIAVARRSGRQWYIGVLNDETTRKIEIPLDTLPGEWTAQSWTDGAVPADVRLASGPAGKTLALDLASGGGAAIILTPR